MKTIELPPGLFAFVDDADYERLNQFRWRAAPSPLGHTFYAVRRVGPVDTIWMHQEVLGVSIEVDHRNGLGLDNRRDNLRACEHWQNRGNSRLYATNRSGYKGVYRDARNGHWIATSCVKAERRHLGCFSTAEEAARAYDADVTMRLGEFARTNAMLGLL